MTQNNQRIDISFQTQLASIKIKSAFFLIVLIASVFMSLYFYINLRKSKEDVESMEAILKKQNARYLELTDSLSYYLSLVDSLSLVKNEKLKEDSKRVIKVSDNVKFLIGIYGLRAPEEKFNKIQSYFLYQGYTLFADFKLQEKPSWLSPQSTVLYYDESSREKALEIATDLERVTGATFIINRGAGLGVKKGQERFTFYIHYIEQS